MRRFGVWHVLKVAAIAAAAAVVFSFAVMGLWNVLMPAIFSVKAISFWQALGLLVLSKLLFGGFRGFPAGGPRWRRRMAERWEQMTPEEREKFKQGMRGRCGPRGNREAEAQA